MEASDHPTDPIQPSEPPPPAGGPPPPPPGGPPPEAPRRLLRSRSDAMIGGVCSGAARYFGVDVTLVRIAMVALTLLGGTGLMLYVAALLLIPEAEDKPPMVDLGGRSQGVKVAGLVVAGLVGFGVLAAIGAVVGWVLFPLAFLVVAGLLAWWVASGERPAGSPGDILKRAGLGLLLLAACFAIGLGGAYAAGTGGGTVAAVLVIVAGAALVAAAFAGGARWLIMPALALGLSAAFVTAAGINLDGGVGRKEFSPATAADVHPSYKLGVGELVVDLRHTQLAAGDHRLRLQVGVGHALLLVPRGVCVTTTARVGLGGVEVFKHGSGGVDVDLTDGRTAPPGTPRIVLNGDTGVGLLEVRHTRPRNLDNRDKGDGIGEPGNFACTGGARAAAGASAPRG